MSNRSSAEIRRGDIVKSWTEVAQKERARLEKEEREKQQHASSSTTRPSPAHLPNSPLIPSGSTPRSKNPRHSGGQQRPGRPFQADSRQPRQNPSQRPQGGIEMQRLGRGGSGGGAGGLGGGQQPRDSSSLEFERDRMVYQEQNQSPGRRRNSHSGCDTCLKGTNTALSCAACVLSPFAGGGE